MAFDQLSVDHIAHFWWENIWIFTASFHQAELIVVVSFLRNYKLARLWIVMLLAKIGDIRYAQGRYD